MFLVIVELKKHSLIKNDNERQQNFLNFINLDFRKNSGLSIPKSSDKYKILTRTIIDSLVKGKRRKVKGKDN